MKLAAKISHLVWAGFWGLFLVWFSIMHGIGGYSYKEAPYLLGVPVFSIAWLTFAVGLLFDRRWAFYGSFLLTVLSLFVAYYVALTSVAIGHSSFLFELIGAVAATLIVWLLLQNRHQFLGRHCSLQTVASMRATSTKKDDRLLKWSASVFFIACWLVPVIPTNYELQPLWPYITEFIGQLREGYFFGAAGYAVLLVCLASIAFLLSVSLGWLVERGVRSCRK